MTELSSPHHTLGDWDIRFNNFILSPAQYVSPPTSAKLRRGVLERGYCRVPGTLCLPEGRIVCWWRAPDTGYNHIHFRCQNELGNADPDFYYYCSFGPLGEIGIGKYVPGWHGDVGDLWYHWPFNTWFQVRLTWEILPPINGNKRMTVKFEARTVGDFVDYGDIIDEDAHFQDSAINRVGLIIRSLTSYNDDYQIYKKA